MSEIIKLQDQDFYTGIMNPFSVLEDLKDNRDNIEGTGRYKKQPNNSRDEK